MLLSLVQELDLPTTLAIVLFLSLSLGIIHHYRQRLLTTHTPSPPVDSKHAWIASSYTFPLPPHSPTCPLTTPPQPYRPFRHGPTYNITMGLRRLAPSSWIELDSSYPHYHLAKTTRLATQPSCLTTLPLALPAAHELLIELTRYLPARYPTLFTATATSITNLHTQETFTLPSPDPLRTAALLIQDDIAIMLPDPASGAYTLYAGAILLPGFWRLKDKIGMSIDQVHLSGNVPGYAPKLQKGINNFFRRVTPEGGVERFNYFFQCDGELGWSSSIGCEDAAEGTFGWGTAETLGREEGGRVWFRSERQTLRRLPGTGAVVFTIRTYFKRLEEVAREKGVAGRLASAIRSWDEETVGYKGRGRYGEAALKLLDEEHERQVKEGVVGGEAGEAGEGGVGGYPW